MTVLHELHQKRPDLLRKHEVYIDGGVTRGTDVLKALCLGARGVGLGRAFLYANGVWGEEGCRRVIESKHNFHCPNHVADTRVQSCVKKLKRECVYWESAVWIN
jgi:glutamate synthase domain-containing protein 2